MRRPIGGVALETSQQARYWTLGNPQGCVVPLLVVGLDRASSYDKTLTCCCLWTVEGLQTLGMRGRALLLARHQVAEPKVPQHNQVVTDVPAEALEAIKAP
jgi:hypothetical protein